jgi:hypothetical protein
MAVASSKRRGRRCILQERFINNNTKWQSRRNSIYSACNIAMQHLRQCAPKEFSKLNERSHAFN